MAAVAAMANATRSAAVALSAEWAAAQRSLSSEEQQLLRVQLCPINLGGSSLNCVSSGSGGCGGGLTFGAATAAGAGVSELIAHSLWLGAGSGASAPTASAAAGDNSVSPAASGTPFTSPTVDSNLSSLSPPTGAARRALLGEQPAALAQFAFNYQSPPPLTAARAYYPYGDFSAVGHVNGGPLLTSVWPAATKEPAGTSGLATTNAGAQMCPPALAIARQQQQSCGGGAPGAPINPGATGLLALVPSTTCSLSNGHDAPTFATAQTDRSSLRTPHYANSLYLNSATSRQNDIFALNPNQIDHNSTSNCSKSELRKELNDQLEYSMPKEEKVVFLIFLFGFSKI